MKHRGLKFLSLLLTLVMVLGMLPGMSLVAYADSPIGISPEGGGSVTPSSLDGNYHSYTAIPAEGYIFQKWTCGAYGDEYGNPTYWNESYGPIIAYFVQVVNVTDVQLDPTVLSLTVGGNAATLTATVAPNNATYKNVTWTTSDPNVASVANGVVTATGVGTATITATATNGTTNTSDDKTATCTVTVNYTVTYVANNGSGETKEYKSAAGETHTVQGQLFPAPEGMEFAGWLGDDGKAYRPGAPITESRTLTAVWETPESSDPQNVPTEEWEYHGGNTEDSAYRSSFAPMQGGRAMLVLNNGETANLMDIYPGTTVWVNPIPDPGYRVASIVWSFIDGSASFDITETRYFIMPTMEVVIFVTFQPIA